MSPVLTRPLARRGLDELLARYPILDVVKVEWGEPDPLLAAITQPWIMVTLGQRSEGREESWARWEFAIWKRTGAVYAVRDGAVSDEPIIEVE